MNSSLRNFQFTFDTSYAIATMGITMALRCATVVSYSPVMGSLILGFYTGVLKRHLLSGVLNK